MDIYHVAVLIALGVIFALAGLFTVRKMVISRNNCLNRPSENETKIDPPIMSRSHKHGRYESK